MTNDQQTSSIILGPGIVSPGAIVKYIYTDDTLAASFFSFCCCIGPTGPSLACFQGASPQDKYPYDMSDSSYSAVTNVCMHRWGWHSQTTGGAPRCTCRTCCPRSFPRPLRYTVLTHSIWLLLALAHQKVVLLMPLDLQEYHVHTALNASCKTANIYRGQHSCFSFACT